MYLTAIVLAAGKGRRLHSKVHKPLAKIKSLPIVIYSLKILNRHPEVCEIIIVVNANNVKDITKFISDYRIRKAKDIVFGGSRRQDSVRNALKSVDAKADLILIHDAARPFVDSGIITRVVKAARKSGAAIVGVPVKDTIKEIRVRRSGGQEVRRTLNRKNSWQIQTPQVFKKSLIFKAYKRFGDSETTDDAFLVEKLGAKVAVVMGSYDNIKITTPEDLIIAQAIAKNKKL